MKTIEVPVEPPECIPDGFGNDFNERLFELCRDDDYRGLYRYFIKLIIEDKNARSL